MDKTILFNILANVIAHVTILTGLIIFAKRIKKYSDALHTRFLIRITALCVVADCILRIYVQINPEVKIRQLIFGSSALVVAIVGFACQPVLTDLVSGFLISINKPFKIGDRIIVEGYEPGIVEDITLRHTVLTIYDDIRIIIPNSQLNSKAVYNTSYKQETRGVHLQFGVSYDTDVQEAMHIIRDCVAESPYTLGVIRNGMEEDSGVVYFLKFGDSALLFETTLWVKPSVSTYIAATDVNMRVLNAFREHGIEIPYQYVNVIEKEENRSISNTHHIIKTAKTPLQRHIRTDTVKMYDTDDPVGAALEAAQDFAKRTNLDKKATNQLRLLAEESVNMVKDMIKETNAVFFVDGSGSGYRVHINMPTDLCKRDYNRILAMSSTGKNEAHKSVYSKILDILHTGLRNIQEDGSEYSWSSEIEDKNSSEDIDNLSKTILLSIADNVKVSVKRDNAEIIVIKDLDLV